MIVILFVSFLAISASSNAADKSSTPNKVTFVVSAKNTSKAYFYLDGKYVSHKNNPVFAHTFNLADKKISVGKHKVRIVRKTKKGKTIKTTKVFVKVAAKDTMPPSKPTSVVANNITKTSATINWTASTDNVGIASYDIYKNNSWIDWSYNSPYVMKNLVCNTVYTSYVVALDRANNYAVSSKVSFKTLPCTIADTTSPTAPINLVSSSITQNNATLSWTASTDAVGVDHYELSKDGSFVKNVAGTSTTVVLACGITSSFTVLAKDAAGNASASSGAKSITGAACGTTPPDNGTATTPSLPGTWALNFSDEFNGTSLDSKWCSSWFNGGSMNNVSTSPSNVSVANGNLEMKLASSSSGSLINTNPNDCGKTGYTFTTGYYAEAKIYFPGSGTNIDNWPAWWTNGQNWPATGEIDIAEGLGPMSSNYHSNSGANNFFPSGSWGGAYHTYAVDREAGVNKIYFDGNLIRTYNTDDNGVPHYLIFNVGGSGVYGEASKMKVDWIRVWKKN